MYEVALGVGTYMDVSISKGSNIRIREGHSCKCHFSVST